MATTDEFLSRLDAALAELQVKVQELTDVTARLQQQVDEAREDTQ